jgi:hypothetical protein
MASILQNISQNRSNKRITLNDIRHAVAGAYMSIYPGMTGYVLKTSGKQHAVANAPHGYITAVKGLSNGGTQRLWNVKFHLVGESADCTSPATMYIKVNNFDRGSPVLPNASVKVGEIKIVLECQRYYGASAKSLLDGRVWSQVSVREAYGFLLLTPKAIPEFALVFTPNQRLFDENQPSD